MISGAEASTDPAPVGEFVRYALAVAGFVVIGVFTKALLTWTMGPIYFLTVLEIAPRTGRLLRRPRTRASRRSGS